MIVLDKITKKLGVRILFEDVSVAFNAGNRYGLTGPNGAGKSTLLKILMGVEDATSGTVSLPKKVGFLKQNIHEFKDFKALDVVIMGNKRLWSAMQEQDALYALEMTDAIGMKLADLEEVVAEENGYTAEADAEMLLGGMGVEEEFYKKPMHALPLDYQFRVLLCQALFGQPDALLLDEPTNHLDLDSIHWLEEFLENYAGTLIVVSHDRHFLNTVCTHIADIDYETVIIYPGNYDSMIVSKSEARSKSELDNKSKEKKVSQLKEFVAKFGAGTRASQVQSRIKEIERLQPQDLKKSNIQRPYIRFNNPEKPSGQIVFKLEHIAKSFNGVSVIPDFSLEIHKGDKIGVIGNNGRGKTTLLRMIAGVLSPDKGQVVLGHQVDLGYFPQNHTDILEKASKESMIDWLRTKKTHVIEQDIRGVLGKLLFSGDEGLKFLYQLSGGETARVILASLMLNNFNTLILDEPNNHLDLESVSALGVGLKEFKGTVVVASHDRDLLTHCATKIISLEEDGIHFHNGPLEEFLKEKEASQRR
jgi:ATPase subunit of ABC transporter with duplicated ATPase domains